MYLSWIALIVEARDCMNELKKLLNGLLKQLLMTLNNSFVLIIQIYKAQRFATLECKSVTKTISVPTDLANRRDEQYSIPENEFTNRFESYLQGSNYQEALQLLQNSKELPSIKSHLLLIFFDRLLEANNIRLCFDFFQMLMCHRPAILTKQIIKKLLGFAVRTGNTTLCRDFVLSLGKNGDLKVQMDHCFRINQYYINCLMKGGNFTLATEAFTNLKQVFPFSESENSLFYYKIYEIMIKSCLSKQLNKVEDAKYYLSEIAVTKPNEIFFNKLISFSSKSCDISFAEYIFSVMVSQEIRPSIVTYNTLIDSYFKQNRASQAWMIFDLLKKTDTTPDNFTYTTMINGLKSIANPDIEKAFVLFAEYKQFNKPDHIIYNCLLDACINAKDLSRAHELYTEMSRDPSIKVDEITYNTLIKGCCRSRKLNQAIMYYQEMMKRGVHPNRITYNSLIDNCVKANKMREAWQFYDEMSHAKIAPDNFTYSILVNGIKSNPTSKTDLYKALELMHHVQSNPEFKPDEILYNSLIDTCIKFNEVSKGFSLFEEMKKKRIEPSPVTYGILIKAYGKTNDLIKAFEMFEQMKNKKMKINEVAYGCLLDACVKNDRMDLALILFDNMKKDNISFNTVHYTTMIKGYSKSGNFEEALRTFYKMKENARTLPNLITYNCIIDACVKVDNISTAIELLNDLLNPSSQLKPDLITFSTLIKGLCMRKEVETAYYYLGLMQEAGIRADEAIFNLVLENCFSVNNYELGLKVFDMMQQTGVLPSNITFSIMIRLHSRAHKLVKVIEVLDIMRGYRIRPSLIIFTNIIQACFKANRMDKVLEMIAELEKTKLKWDAIFYSKLISGFLNFNRLDVALSYWERSIHDQIFLGQEVYTQLISSLQASNFMNKFEIIGKIEASMKYPMHGKQSGMSQGQYFNSYSTSNKKNLAVPYVKEFIREEEKENQNINILQGQVNSFRPFHQQKGNFYPNKTDQQYIGSNPQQNVNNGYYSQPNISQIIGIPTQSSYNNFPTTTQINQKQTQTTKKPLKLGTRAFIVDSKSSC